MTNGPFQCYDGRTTVARAFPCPAGRPRGKIASSVTNSAA